MTATDAPPRGTSRLSFRARLESEVVSAGSFRVFRFFFGLVVALSLVRFVLKGWHVTLVAEPTFRFPWPGLGWVPRPDADGALVLALVGATSAIVMALGRWPRLSAAIAGLAVVWLKSSDLAFYLNHDVFVVIVLGLLTCVRHPGRGETTLAARTLWLLRFQVAMLYVHAGIAKVQPDWLILHEPLTTWLRAYGDWPVIGALTSAAWAPAVMSWAGCLFDLLIVPALLVRRTRPVAAAAVVAFHLLTGALFPIGIFPIVMIITVTLWFEPAWPDRWLRRAGAPVGSSTSSEARRVSPVSPLARTLVLIWLLLNIFVPLRGALAGKDVLWSGDGYRFSWRVMVAEKTGYVVFNMHERPTGRRWELDPVHELTALQYREMTTEPEMLLFYAHTLCKRWSAGASTSVEVHADAWMSLNGRAMGRLVRPELDLCAVPPGAPSEAWLLPRPAARTTP